MNARENDLGAGGADVDADRHQRDVVLPPQRIVLERAVVGVEIVVVIVVGIVGVNMDDIAAVQMVGERVGRFLILVVGHMLFPCYFPLAFVILFSRRGAQVNTGGDISGLERQL